MMDNPNITMEEYIKLQAEKTQRCGWMFNWQAATYGKIYCDDHDYFIDFEADYPAVVYDDALTLNENVSLEPTINMALPPKDQRNQYLVFEGLEYSKGDIADFEDRLGKRYYRGLHQMLRVRVYLLAALGGGYLRFEARCIAGKSQAPKKVTVTDLFYLQGMDVDSINIHYRLARYLRRFASRRKQGELDDTWGWVASGPERQPNAAASALEVAKGAPNVDKGA
uniref:Uncharacterized protein n=1 Tax=Tanacetum cinerariifolium TaxID=118510 RepID=A0A699GFV7_TANCI|nr:hypothetical protein [Tanacetum cinerariifolium]